MALIDDVKAAKDAVVAAAAKIGSDISDAKTALEAEIKRLEALLTGGSGATDAQLQDILDGLNTANASLTTADANAAAIKSEADAERP